MGHPLETGLVWHRTLGVPYLPGSSVKGLIRAWAERWGGSTDTGEVIRLFGPRGEDAKAHPSTGALVVFDALPVQPPRLDVDIMNPHYAPYYQEGKPPADYHLPVPIFFLAVAPGQAFEFALAPRPGVYGREEAEQAKADLTTGMSLLQDALASIGAGGKTAVGYGYFKKVKT
jgi:CRISPR-associated protein Cmr6